MARLTAKARANAQRILEREARRLLDEQLDVDPVIVAARSDADPLHGCSDEIALSGEGKSIPVRPGQREGAARAA